MAEISRMFEEKLSQPANGIFGRLEVNFHLPSLDIMLLGFSKNAINLTVIHLSE